MPSARALPSPIGQKQTQSLRRASPLRAAWDYFRQMISLGRFVVTGLVVCPLCTAALWVLGDRIPATTGQGLIQWLFDSWLKFSIKIGVFAVDFPEAEKLRDLRSAIVAPNHPSQLDAVLLLIAVPRAVCIMRASLMNSPWLGGAARLARFVTNDQGSTLIREGIEKLRQGENLLIFPEGTRSHQQAVNSFKQGFALIATKTDAPIQTVFIEREGMYLAKGVSLLAPAALPIRLRVHLGDVFHPLPGETAKELSARLESYFRARLENTGEAIRLLPVTPS